MIALALAVVLETGATRYDIQPDGIWRQAGAAPYTLVRNTPQVSIGVARGPWSAGYTHLGQIRSDALATAADAFYVGGRCAQWCNDLPRYMGAGYVHGVFVRRDWNLGSGWRVEAGAFAYQPRWRVHVRGWWPGQNGGTPADGLRDFTVTARERLSATPTVGLSWGGNDWRAVVRVYGMLTAGGDYNSLYHGQTVTAGLQVRW